MPATALATIRLRWNRNLCSSTNQLGRIDIAVAPEIEITFMSGTIRLLDAMPLAAMPMVVSSAPGLPRMEAQAGVYGGLSKVARFGGLWHFDYPQNWYNQGVAVDPNDPDRVFFDTFDSGLQRAQGMCGTIPLAVIPERTRARCT